MSFLNHHLTKKSTSSQWTAAATRVPWTLSTRTVHQSTLRAPLQKPLPLQKQPISQAVSPSHDAPSCAKTCPLTFVFAVFFNSPSKPAGGNPNPFAAAAARNSPFKQTLGQPPRSQFNPQIPNPPSAAAFRNPAFTTPQKRIDELAYSEYSGAESSPAFTDRSDITPETPDVDQDDDFGRMTITPHTANRALFGKSVVRSRTPGRGELVRGNRDKIRKRRRQVGDKDVGSVRSRLPHGSDDSDSDWEEGANPAGAKKTKKGKGWLGGFLRAISDHPSAPAILSKWLQLGVNLVLMGLVVFGMVAIFLQVRSDLAHANEMARAELVSKMSICSDSYLKNGCAPKSSRAPALEGACNEWEACMNQDPAAIMQVQVTVRNMGAVLNEFTDSFTFKTWVSSGTGTSSAISANLHLGVHRLDGDGGHYWHQHRLWVSSRHGNPAPSATC